MPVDSGHRQGSQHPTQAIGKPDSVARGILDRALPTVREEVKVVKAALAGNAGVVGSAALARPRIGEDV